VQLPLNLQHQRPDTRRVLADTKRSNQLVDGELGGSNGTKAEGFAPPDQPLVGRDLDEERVRGGQVAVTPGRRSGLASSLERDAQCDGLYAGNDHVEGTPAYSPPLIPKFESYRYR
jgi:hypothetical protein